MTNKTVKIIISVSAIIIVGVAAAFYINYRMKVSDMNEKLIGIIDKDQGSMEITLKLPGSEATYDETYSLCDKCINDRLQLITNLRSINPDMKNELKDSLMDFLSLENELLRNMKSIYRHYMELTFKLANMKRLASSDYSYLYNSAIRSDYEEAREASTQGLQSVSSFKDKYTTLMRKESDIAKQTGKANLRFAQIFGKYQGPNFAFTDMVTKGCKYILEYGDNTE